jgi:hypothetical protein
LKGNLVLAFSLNGRRKAEFGRHNILTLYISALVRAFNGPMVLAIPAPEGTFGIFASDARLVLIRY